MPCCRVKAHAAQGAHSLSRGARTTGKTRSKVLPRWCMRFGRLRQYAPSWHCLCALRLAATGEGRGRGSSMVCGVRCPSSPRRTSPGDLTHPTRPTFPLAVPVRGVTEREETGWGPVV